jgi:pyridinium-3,5-biscarboxylic acid mononucleotide synthase
MQEAELIDVLEGVRSGAITPQQAALALRAGPFRRSELEFADVDHHRSLRHGLGEVIYGEGKTIQQILSITERLARSGSPVLITRLESEKLSSLTQRYPQGRANDAARTFIVNPLPPKDSSRGEPYVAILAAGTGDLSVAEEACEVCVAMNTAFEKFYDVGVAGLHRLLNKTDEIQGASALVVVAGMEGALPSVVGGLFGKPLFAVPTSVGYGASFGGVAALLAMINSCAPGVAVVNIDNGFSAGFAACQVIRQILRNRDE